MSLAYAGQRDRCCGANEAQSSPQQGQVRLIYGLLAQVLRVLPENARPLVQMDRGLAHSSAMLRALHSLGVDYLVRVKNTARFTSANGCSQRLKHWVIFDHAYTLRGTLFDHDHACPGTICLLWEAGQREAWCLFTNLKRNVGRYYAIHMWQEESYRDLKSAGWHWPDSHLTCPSRMERLILIMSIAYAFAIRSGLLVWQHPPASGLKRLPLMSCPV